jgi:hypothetical protein
MAAQGIAMLVQDLVVVEQTPREALGLQPFQVLEVLAVLELAAQ